MENEPERGHVARSVLIAVSRLNRKTRRRAIPFLEKRAPQPQFRGRWKREAPTSKPEYPEAQMSTEQYFLGLKVVDLRSYRRPVAADPL